MKLCFECHDSTYLAKECRNILFAAYVVLEGSGSMKVLSGEERSRRSECNSECKWDDYPKSY